LSGATTSLRDALQGFANPVPFFLISVLTMGVAVVRSGLAERLARTILERARGRSLTVYLQLVLSFPVLTFLLPSATTRSGILIHIYDEVFALGRVARGADVAKAVMLALSSINRLASTSLLTGGITPVMSAAIIGGMSWTGWFALMAVPYYAILLLGGALTYALYRRGFAQGLPTPEPARRRPISGAEWRTIGIILSASALWLTDGVHHLDPALPAFGDSALNVVVLLMLGATLLRALVPNISGFLALALPIAMSVGREAGVNPLVCALVVMMTGDAVVYYPAQSSSALVIYERGHVSAGEMLKFGLWMTLVGWVAILVVALPWWALIGEPLRSR